MVTSQPRMKHTRLCTLWFAGLCLVAVSAARAYAQDLEPSPFLPPGAPQGGGPGGSAESTTPELRGIMSTPQGTRYCIYDPAKKSSSWSAVNEPGFDFLVKSADPGHNVVFVQQAGRTYRLEMKEARITAMSGGATITIARINPGGVNVAALSPAEEAARLQAVAEEVRRRRQLRMQNAQQGVQSVQPGRPPQGEPPPPP